MLSRNFGILNIPLLQVPVFTTPTQPIQQVKRKIFDDFKMTNCFLGIFYFIYLLDVSEK